MSTETINRTKQLHEVEEENEYMGKNKPVNLQLPIVSVCVATYQHAKYIENCIDGILMQKVNFNYEIIIGEDESQDGTREICIDYAKKYPDKIRLFLRDRKTSIYYKDDKFLTRLNGVWCRMSARGKYIAPCEGDDYWTDPLKLQKQVDFLESHEDYILVCGGFKAIGPDERKEEILTNIVSLGQEDEKGFTFTLKDLGKAWFTKTLTVLFRNVPNLDNYASIYDYSRDVHLFYSLLKMGKGYYMKQVLGIYNKHEGGIYSLKSREEKLISHYHIYKDMYEKSPDEYTRGSYLMVCQDLLNLKLSFMMKDKTIKLKRLLNVILKLTKNRTEFVRLLKSLVPLRLKYFMHREPGHAIIG